MAKKFRNPDNMPVIYRSSMNTKNLHLANTPTENDIEIRFNNIRGDFDKRILFCHRIILDQYCPELADRINDQDIIHLDTIHFDPAAVKDIINLFYESEITLTWDNVFKIFTVAREFRVKAAEANCEHYFREYFVKAQPFRLYYFVRKNNLGDVEMACIKELVDNSFQKAYNSDDMAYISWLTLEDLISLIHKARAYLNRTIFFKPAYSSDHKRMCLKRLLETAICWVDFMPKAMDNRSDALSLIVGAIIDKDVPDNDIYILNMLCVNVRDNLKKRGVCRLTTSRRLWTISGQCKDSDFKQYLQAGYKSPCFDAFLDLLSPNEIGKTVSKTEAENELSFTDKLLLITAATCFGISGACLIELILFSRR